MNVKRYNWKDPKLVRVGFLFVVFESNDIYCCLTLDKYICAIGDFGGHIEKSDFDGLDAAIREYREEAKNLFGELNREKLMNFPVLDGEDSAEIIVPLDLTRIGMIQKIVKMKKLNRKDPNNEVQNIIWINSNQLEFILDQKKLIIGKTNIISFYPRLFKLFKDNIFRLKNIFFEFKKICIEDKFLPKEKTEYQKSDSPYVFVFIQKISSEDYFTFYFGDNNYLILNLKDDFKIIENIMLDSVTTKIFVQSTINVKKYLLSNDLCDVHLKNLSEIIKIKPLLKIMFDYNNPITSGVKITRNISEIVEIDEFLKDSVGESFGNFKSIYYSGIREAHLFLLSLSNLFKNCFENEDLQKSKFFKDFSKAFVIRKNLDYLDIIKKNRDLNL